MRFPFPPIELEGSPAAPEKQVCEASQVNLTAGDGFRADPVVAAGLAETTELVSVSAHTPAVADEQSGTEIAAIAEEPELASFLPDAALELYPPPAPAPISPPQRQRKVIAFPRPASATLETFDRLADPAVPEQLRILDVPEELEAFPTAPLLDGLQLPPGAQQAAVGPADHIELPFQAAYISQRLYAGLIDCAIVAAATAVFGAVIYKMLPRLTVTKPFLMAAGAVPAMLWAVYQCVFTMYSGATPGMRMLGLRWRTFQGADLSWRHRRSRVIGLYFSTASLMMGLLWALVDVDALCWHDRISRTYPANRE
ncbi:MAG: RDD family protein [Candidatus Korobacteraceae bacterium]|jgi:uncharacterized RDD family membrane protein YckC